MMAISLNSRNHPELVALIDDDDHELVAAYRWYAKAGSSPTGQTLIYAIAGPRRTGPRMHRLITGWPMVDHVDHDGLNNQRSNLRPITPAMNQANSRPMAGSVSRFKGVYLDRRSNRWYAQIKVARKTRSLGTFSSEDAAARAYDIAAADAWGEYAALNFPVSGS